MVKHYGRYDLFTHDPPKTGIAKHFGYVNGEFVEELVYKYRAVV
jgi:hypothetical protein